MSILVAGAGIDGCEGAIGRRCGPWERRISYDRQDEYDPDWVHDFKCGFREIVEERCREKRKFQRAY